MGRLCGFRWLSFAIRLLVALALYAGIVVPANAATKVALVIGNSAYQNVAALPNPSNDAADIAAAFQRLDFSVRLVANATYDDMRRALLRFSQEARDAEMAVVFFAGHGIEVNDENWLVPIDAELKTDLDTAQEAISLRSVMLMVSNASKLGLVVLDACRNNPFLAKMRRAVATRSTSRGLYRVEPVNNVLVAYAAKDGTTAADGNGRNSPFTAALLKYIETPGLEINFLFRNVRDEVIAATASEQQPFVYGSLSKQAIYLKPPLPAPVAPGPDEVAWSLLKDTTDEAALRRFMTQYPNSSLRKEADARIAALAAERAARPIVPSPDEVAWGMVKDSKDPGQLRRFIDQFPDSNKRPSAEQQITALDVMRADAAILAATTRHELIRSLQVELKRVGCLEGPVSGELDDPTRTALHDFARLSSISVPDDEPSPDALKAVRGVGRRVCAAQAVADPPKAPPAKAPPALSPRAPAAKGARKCFSFQGRQFCE